MSFYISSIVTTFDVAAIGTKVVDPEGFWRAAETAVALHDFAADRVPGQGHVDCPAAIPCVSAGVGLRLTDPDAYVCRLHRGRVGAYLRREHAAPVESCALVVYTRAAYLVDPDVTPEEAARVGDAAHVLVAVLASAGPASPLTTHRLVANLAGGNREALAWTAEEIRAKAREVARYDALWSVVAD